MRCKCSLLSIGDGGGTSASLGLLFEHGFKRFDGNGIWFVALPYAMLLDVPPQT